MREFLIATMNDNCQDAMVLVISFGLAFVSAFGRGILMKRPPGFIYKLIDAALCGAIAVPVTGMAIYDFHVSIWGSWTSAFCFGSLGFLFFYDLLKSFAPILRKSISKKVGNDD